MEIETQYIKPKKKKTNPKIITNEINLGEDKVSELNEKINFNDEENQNNNLDMLSNSNSKGNIKEDPINNILCADEKTMENLKHLLMMPNFENYLKNLEFVIFPHYYRKN